MHIFKKEPAKGEPEEVFDIQGDNIWYVHIDDDDYVDGNMLKELYGLAMDTGSDIVTVGSCYVCPDGTMTNKYVYDGVYTVDRIESTITMSGKPMYYFYRHDKNLSGLNTKEQILHYIVNILL